MSSRHPRTRRRTTQAPMQTTDRQHVELPAATIDLDVDPPGLGRDYARLWVATAITNVGDGLRVTALPLLAASISEQPLSVAAIMFASKLPWLLLALHAGALIDRFDRTRLIALTNAGRAIVVGAFALGVHLGMASLPLLYLLALIQGIGEVFSDSAAFALLPRIVPTSRLEKANGRLEAAVVTSNEFAGPALGGLLFAAGAALPFALDSISFLCASVLIGGISISETERSRHKGSMMEEIKEGLNWLMKERLLRNLSFIAAATNLWLHATFAIAVLFAAKILGLGAVGFGLLLGVEAFGALAGSLAAAGLRSRLGTRHSVMLALAAAGLANVAITRASSALFVGLMAIAVSFGGGLWNVVTNSLRQHLVPNHLLGRVQSAHRLMSWGAIPLGTLLGGVLAELYGLRAPFAFAGISLCILCGACWWVLHERFVPAEETRQAG